MIETDYKRAGCDWPRCAEEIYLKTKTRREQLAELKRAGWRASEDLGKFCICKQHNESREWD